MNRYIGALTIGQSPRPDLLALLRGIPRNYDILEVGALDSLEREDLADASGSKYPLTTRLNDGTIVTVSEELLLPRLQKALDRLERQNVVGTILLCAGSFSELRGTRLLFKPTNVTYAVLGALGIRRVGVLCPLEEQASAVRQKWATAGFRPTVWTASLDEEPDQVGEWIARQVSAIDGLECIVLDYVGHTPDQVRYVREIIDVPVLDLGELAVAAMISTL